MFLKNDINRIVPQLHQTFIKLHKRNHPIRHLKNVKTAPSYSLVQHSNSLIKRK